MTKKVLESKKSKAREELAELTAAPLTPLDETDIAYVDTPGDFDASPPDTARQLQYPILNGIDIPSKKKNPSRIDKERWVIAIERLMSRGILSIAQLSQVTGLSAKQTEVLVESVKTAWSKTLTTGQVNIRREKLYYEADRVTQEAWNMYNDPEASLPSKAVAMKLILDANKRKAALIGAERIEVQVDSNTSQDNRVPAEIERDLEKRMGVSEGFLQALGKTISQKMVEERNQEEEEEDEAWRGVIDKQAEDAEYIDIEETDED